MGCGCVGCVKRYVDDCGGGVCGRCLEVMCRGCVCVVCGYVVLGSSHGMGVMWDGWA